MTDGEKVRFFRGERRLTQTGLANAAGLSPAAISDYELGKIHCTPAQAVRLAKGLRVNPYALGADVGHLRYDGDLGAFLFWGLDHGVFFLPGGHLCDERFAVSVHPDMENVLREVRLLPGKEAGTRRREPVTGNRVLSVGDSLFTLNARLLAWYWMTRHPENYSGIDIEKRRLLCFLQDNRL